jgi:hypothetical protein
MTEVTKRTEQRNMKNSGYIPVRAWLTPKQADQAQAWNDENIAKEQPRKSKRTTKEN